MFNKKKIVSKYLNYVWIVVFMSVFQVETAFEHVDVVTVLQRKTQACLSWVQSVPIMDFLQMHCSIFEWVQPLCNHH